MIRYDKERQGVIRCDKEIGAWELYLKLQNKNGFAYNLRDKL